MILPISTVFAQSIDSFFGAAAVCMLCRDPRRLRALPLLFGLADSAAGLMGAAIPHSRHGEIASVAAVLVVACALALRSSARITLALPLLFAIDNLVFASPFTPDTYETAFTTAIASAAFAYLAIVCSARVDPYLTPRQRAWLVCGLIPACFLV